MKGVCNAPHHEAESRSSQNAQPDKDRHHNQDDLHRIVALWRWRGGHRLCYRNCDRLCYWHCDWLCCRRRDWLCRRCHRRSAGCARIGSSGNFSPAFRTETSHVDLLFDRRFSRVLLLRPAGYANIPQHDTLSPSISSAFMAICPGAPPPTGKMRKPHSITARDCGREPQEGVLCRGPKGRNVKLKALRRLSVYSLPPHAVS